RGSVRPLRGAGAAVRRGGLGARAGHQPRPPAARGLDRVPETGGRWRARRARGAALHPGRLHLAPPRARVVARRAALDPRRGLPRTTRVSLAGPAERRLTLGLSYQHREVEPLADLSRSRSDLGNVSMRVEDPARGLGGQMHLEVTAEGENRRVRRLTYAGAGLGAYDSLGNYLGHGDYDLALVVSPELDRVERAALST